MLRAQPGQVFEVAVTSPLADNAPFRLVVAGTGFKQGVKGAEAEVDLFNHLNIVGPHQRNFCQSAPKAC